MKEGEAAKAALLTPVSGSLSPAMSPKRAKRSNVKKAAMIAVNSPLHWACFKGHEMIVYLLLAAGFSTLDVDHCGNNARHLAAGNLLISYSCVT